MYWMCYSGFIRMYGLAIHLAALWSEKARKWIRGRESQDIPSYDKSSIWFHVASLGEFEQARPLIEAIRSRDPHQIIVLSFFSPSGFEQTQHYKSVDSIIYLPLDTKKNARMLLNKLRPKLLIFTKYDLWFNLIREAQSRDVPCILISTSFRDNQIYFSAIGSPLLKFLQGFKLISVQDERSMDVARKAGLQNLHLGGDTRIDRVLQINDREPEIPESINSFIGESRIFILGSSWEKDETLVLSYLQEKLPQGWKVIIAPHEVREANLRRIERLLDDQSLRLSQLDTSKSFRDYLVVDSIGLLNRLYARSHIAFIGGGFGRGIHNTLEPAAAHLPIIFGPNYTKFREARDMIQLGTAFSINNAVELDEVLTNLWDPQNHKVLSRIQEEYIKEKSGATSEIVDLLTQEGLIK